MDSQLIAWQELASQLQAAKSLKAKRQILEQLPAVTQFLDRRPQLSHYIQQAPLQHAMGLLQLIAIGQTAVFGSDTDLKNKHASLKQLAEQLALVDRFYCDIGGIVGYHTTVCSLLAGKASSTGVEAASHCLPPPVVDMRDDRIALAHAVRAGLEALPRMAEIYVVGGAAERLAWCDAPGGEKQPAARLPFMGRSLLEGLVRDLQAREYLFYKLYGRQETVPLALMTSYEKNNHSQIHALCAENGWYGRPSEDWLFFSQPLVPLIGVDGLWCVEDAYQLVWRPGGHGILWKLAAEEEILDQLKQRGCQHLLVRQINNPLGDTDGGLLALAGVGKQSDRGFGFLACPRLPGTQEGVDVLVQFPADKGVRYAITNLEYTALQRAGVEEQLAAGEFPANTNLLYADIDTIEHALAVNPLPGMLVNAKSVACGQVAGRLETTMQNIADSIVSEVYAAKTPVEQLQLPSYIVYRERLKTIAVAKKAYQKGQPLEETPEGAYYAVLQNYADMLQNYCHVDMPSVGSEEAYQKNQWGFIAYLHPALGPVFEIVAQKIQGGRIAPGSELELEIAEVSLRDLSLEGSLSIVAGDVLGEKNKEGVIRYSEKNGKCALHNVSVRNAGVNRKDNCIPWRKQYQRKAAVRIILHGDAEFYANGVTFIGDHTFEVPAGHRMRVKQQGDNLEVDLQPIQTASWWWEYSYVTDNSILLSKAAYV
jgi:hypothetical protein